MKRALVLAPSVFLAVCLLVACGPKPDDGFADADALAAADFDAFYGADVTTVDEGDELDLIGGTWCAGGGWEIYAENWRAETAWDEVAVFRWNLETGAFGEGWKLNHTDTDTWELHISDDDMGWSCTDSGADAVVIAVRSGTLVSPPGRSGVRGDALGYGFLSRGGGGVTFEVLSGGRATEAQLTFADPVSREVVQVEGFTELEDGLFELRVDLNDDLPFENPWSVAWGIQLRAGDEVVGTAVR